MTIDLLRITSCQAPNADAACRAIARFVAVDG
jgi:hypothetical protein